MENDTKKISSFDAVRREEKFEAAFPDYVERIKTLEKLQRVELCLAGKDISKVKEVQNKYAKAFEQIADNILEEDSNRTDIEAVSKKHKIPLTYDLIKLLNDKKDEFIEIGLIKLEKFAPRCLVSGKVLNSGDLFLKMDDGSSDAISLECCTVDNYIGFGAVLCCVA